MVSQKFTSPRGIGLQCHHAKLTWSFPLKKKGAICRSGCFDTKSGKGTDTSHEPYFCLVSVYQPAPYLHLPPPFSPSPRVPTFGLCPPSFTQYIAIWEVGVGIVRACLSVPTLFFCRATSTRNVQSTVCWRGRQWHNCSPPVLQSFCFLLSPIRGLGDYCARKQIHCDQRGSEDC